MANRFWIYVAKSGGALLGFGSLALLLKAIRREPSESSETQIRSTPRTPIIIQAAAFYDVGKQEIDTEKDIVKGPAVSLRLYPDEGRVSIDQPKIIKKE